jgi:hypothetical protein
MSRCRRPASRAVSSLVCANEKNPDLRVDRKLLGTFTIGSHRARPVPAVAPRDPLRLADATHRVASQLSVLTAATRSNCLVLSVMSTASTGWVWAAIIRSYGSISRPRFSRSARIGGRAGSRAVRTTRTAQPPEEAAFSAADWRVENQPSRGDTIRTCDLYVPNVAL